MLIEDNPVIQGIYFFFLRAKDLRNKIILGDRCSFLFQVPTVKEYNGTLLKSCQVLTPTFHSTQEMHGEKVYYLSLMLN